MSIPSLSVVVSRRNEGDNQDFNRLIGVLRSQDLSLSQFTSILLDFSQNISLLAQPYHELVTSVLQVPLPCLPSNVMLIYMSFIESLLSAHAYYLQPVLSKVVSYFSWDDDNPHLWNKQDLDNEISATTAAKKQQQSEDLLLYQTTILNDKYHAHIHETLFAIVKVVPTCTNALIDVLKSTFPHKKRSCFRHEMYLRNLLTVISYVPVLRQQILSLAIHRMIKIDVEIFEALAGEESSDESESESEIEEDEIPASFTEDEFGGRSFEMDYNPMLLKSVESKSCLDSHIPMNKHRKSISFAMEEDEEKIIEENEDENDDEELDESDEDSEDSFDNEDENANKLDKMMCVLFEYLNENFFSGSGEDQDAAILFIQLLTIFDKIILTTHKSKYTQFLLFYSCSIHSLLPSLFVEFLTKKLFNPNTPPVIRQSVAMYISSFIARHDGVDIDVAGKTLISLVNWIIKYINANDKKSNYNNIDVRLHQVFYSMCQSVMYHYCFTHERLQAHYGLTWIQNLRFDRIIQCNLNPLKVCTPVIVNEFANITRNQQILYCYSIIERNKSIAISTLSCAVGGRNTLDTFFPFDPYSLKESSKYISNYVHWKSSDINGDVDEPMEEDELMFEM